MCASIPTLSAVPVVLCGSFRRDPAGLHAAYDALVALGCRLLSPEGMEPASERGGFVFLKGQEDEDPGQIETRHLEAVQQAAFVWLHLSEGYVGASTALEIGMAHACGVPVFASQAPAEPVFRTFVQVVASPQAALAAVQTAPASVPRALRSYQASYRRLAQARGYANEDAGDCLLLLVEEVGELARALRKRAGLVRHQEPAQTNEAQEMADVFNYLTHLANILEIDLAEAVLAKERVNHARFLAKKGEPLGPTHK